MSLLKFSLGTLLLFLSHCQRSENKNAADKPAYTDTLFGGYYFRLHNPEPGPAPKLWQGPVEIGKHPDSFHCKIDTSIIRGLETDTARDEFIIQVASGSDTGSIGVYVPACSLFVVDSVSPYIKNIRETDIQWGTAVDSNVVHFKLMGADSFYVPIECAGPSLKLSPELGELGGYEIGSYIGCFKNMRLKHHGYLFYISPLFDALSSYFNWEHDENLVDKAENYLLSIRDTAITGVVLTPSNLKGLRYFVLVAGPEDEASGAPRQYLVPPGTYDFTITLSIDTCLAERVVGEDLGGDSECAYYVNKPTWVGEMKTMGTIKNAGDSLKVYHEGSLVLALPYR